MGANIPGTYGDDITPEQIQEAAERALKASVEIGPLIAHVSMRRADIEAIPTKPCNPGLPPANPYNIIGVEVRFDESLPAPVAYRMVMTDGETVDIMRNGEVYINHALTQLRQAGRSRLPGALFEMGERRAKRG